MIIKMLSSLILAMLMLMAVPILYAKDPSYAKRSMSICQLAQHPSLYEGREVTVLGYVHAGMEIYNISDEKCHKNPMLLDIEESTFDKTNIQFFLRSLYKNGGGGISIVRGTFYQNDNSVIYKSKIVLRDAKLLLSSQKYRQK